MPAVVTLTPAPVIDRIHRIDALDPGRVHRADVARESTSGKGLNVARGLRTAGRRALAVLPLGAEDAATALRGLDERMLRVIPVAGRIRRNTCLIEQDGRTTNINEPAVPIGAADWARVIDGAIEAIEEAAAAWLVISGSLPEGGDGALLDLAPLIDAARARDVRVAVDSSGPALQRWGRSERVELIKPNLDELAALVGRPLRTIGAAVEAAQEIAGSGARLVLASLGPDGALAVTAESVHWASAEAPGVVNTTGAGDAFLAGFLAAALPDGAIETDTGLLQAVAFGAHAVSLPTTVLEAIETAPAGRLGAVDRDRVLQAPGRPG